MISVLQIVKNVDETRNVFSARMVTIYRTILQLQLVSLNVQLINTKVRMMQILKGLADAMNVPKNVLNVIIL